MAQTADIAKKEDKEDKETGRPQLSGILGSDLFTVEGVMMLMAAGIIDLLGLVDAIPIAGTILSFFVDIVGVLLIGGWMFFFRTNKIEVTTKVTGRFAKAGRLLRKQGRVGRILLRIFCIGGEFIPVVGVLPLWTVLVFFELRQS